MKQKDMEERDRALYYIEKPDPNFSPVKNKLIVEASIKKYEAMRRKQVTDLRDPYAERASAVVDYLRASDKVGGNKDMKKYFSPSMLAYLRGEEIRKKLMAGMKIIGEQGHGIKRRF